MPTPEEVAARFGVPKDVFDQMVPEIAIHSSVVLQAAALMAGTFAAGRASDENDKACMAILYLVHQMLKEMDPHQMRRSLITALKYIAYGLLATEEGATYIGDVLDTLTKEGPEWFILMAKTGNRSDQT